MLGQLFLSFLKIGTFGYGSGPAMLVLIEREMVGRELMTSEQFTSAVAMGTALPGPIATKMSLYCGYQAGGVAGALVALLGVLLPSTLAMLLLAKFVMEFRGHPKLDGVLRAMKPVVVAIFLVLAINSARGLRPGWDAVLLGALALVLLLLKVDPVWVVLGAVGVGLVFF